MENLDIMVGSASILVITDCDLSTYAGVGMHCRATPYWKSMFHHASLFVSSEG